MQAEGAGTGLTVTVRDAAGSPIVGAVASITTPGGGEARAVTASGGVAQIGGLSDGTYGLAVAASGFQPRIVDVDIVDGTGTVAVSLLEGEFASASMTVRRLTPAEIAAAGIDVNDPENQHIQEFAIRLSDGRELRGLSGGRGWSSTVDGFHCGPTSCTSEDGNEDGRRRTTTVTRATTTSTPCCPSSRRAG